MLSRTRAATSSAAACASVRECLLKALLSDSPLWAAWKYCQRVFVAVVSGSCQVEMSRRRLNRLGCNAFAEQCQHLRGDRRIVPDELQKGPTGEHESSDRRGRDYGRSARDVCDERDLAHP